MVFYRKYRPQTLTDLIGQDQVKQTLATAFKTGKLSHAYLFYGPKGTGKTSTARILAKMVNCEQLHPGGGHEVNASLHPRGVGEIPCNKCASCLSITDGSNLDLIEIDAASNRGIDDVRLLRENIKLSPSVARKKVYIIDEVHMLTNEAFNALLKTLEEPPEHVLFILATTEVQKLPETILSRVTRLDFKLASHAELVTALKKVVDAEKLEAKDEALSVIAVKSESSFRDALKLLDQLSASSEKITPELVEGLLRSGNFETLKSFLEFLAKRDTKSALEVVDKQLNEGTNLKEFINSVLDILRVILLYKNGSVKSVEELGGSKQVEVKNLADSFITSDLTKLINLLLESLEKMRFASIPSLPLEIAVVESCMIRDTKEEAEFKGNSETIKMTKVIQESEIVIASPGSESGVNSAKQSQTPDSEIASGSMNPRNDGGVDDIASGDIVTLRDKWAYVLETIKPYNYSLEALLKQAKLINCEEGQVLLEVPYSFHQRILEAPKSKDLLESVLSDVLAKPIKVFTSLGQRPVRVEELANVEVAADDEVIKIAAEIFNS